ncbi:potassium voltage-gated channel protein Shaw-like [Tubulanus polymorphus]|uniref:potassium voltage-gated channel protein Shaw-like n=1 Tax=Tubulanus polymorphus TaxID=672921 RepID=UPI003DA5FDBB
MATSMQIVTESGNSLYNTTELNSIKVRLNIGGRIFTTLRKTLLKIRTSRLGKIFSKLEIPDNCRCVSLYFDRDPTLFNAILGCYRDGQMHVPQSICVDLLEQELKFWKISRDYMAPCCLYWVGEKTGQQETLNELDRTYYVDYESILRKAYKRSEICGNMARVWLHLEYPGYSTFSKVWAIIVSLVATMSVINISISFSVWGRIPLPLNVSVLADEYNMNNSAKWKYFYAETQISRWLLILDMTLNIVLTLEFVMRFITIPDKCEFMKSFNNWLDFVTIVPSWIFFALQWTTLINDYYMYPKYIIVVQMFMMLRILKLNRLAAVFGGLRVLIVLVRKNLKELFTLVILFFLGTMIFALLAFEVEIQKDSFPNIISAYWWAIVTMTTVGFGDYYPLTPFGYIVGGLCALSGLLLTGMIIPILGNNFSIYYNYSKNNSKKSETHELRAKSIERSKTKKLGMIFRININDIDTPQTRV